MHALTVFTHITAMAFYAVVFAQKDTLNSTDTSTTPKIETSTVLTCSTARRDTGTCVGRERCDYGTASIDFTLYVPSDYTRPCSEDMVCCPAEYIIPAPEPTFREPINFDFDDDD